MTGDAIGLVGLCPLGRAVAERLAACGRRVVAFDADPALRAALLRAPRLEHAAGLADVGAECRTVITLTPSPEALMMALFGTPDRPGLAHDLVPGSLVVEMSLGDPALLPRIQGALGPRAIGIVDAVPRHADPRAALSGRLRLALGGYPDFTQRATEALTDLGSVERTGPLGSARAAAIIARAHDIAVSAATAEAEALAAAAGVALSVPDWLGTERADTASIARIGHDAAASEAATLAVEIAHRAGLDTPIIATLARRAPLTSADNDDGG